MKNLKLFAPLLIFISTLSYSQIDKSSAGLGLGLDYGGIGMNLTRYLTKSMGLYAGVGYALADFGFNGGIKFRFISETSRVVPFLTAMYGYNTAVVVSNAAPYNYNKMFYGPSVGFGLDFRGRPEKKGYFSFALIVPIRGSEVDSYLNNLRNKGVSIGSPLPISVSIGYRFILIKN